MRTYPPRCRNCQAVAPACTLPGMDGLCVRCWKLAATPKPAEPEPAPHAEPEVTVHVCRPVKPAKPKVDAAGVKPGPYLDWLRERGRA